MPITSAELGKRFVLDKSVKFTEFKDEDFKSLGPKGVPASYRIVKRAFGDSRLDSESVRFWISTPKDGNHNYNIAELQKMLGYRLENHFNRYNQAWHLLAARGGIDVTSPLFALGKLVPFFCNSEYDYWLCWNLGKVGLDGEPEIISFDFGQRKVLGIYPNLVAVYEALSEGLLVEPLPKDGQGRIKLTSFEAW